MPFNLDAVAIENGHEPFIFIFGGDEYTFPAQIDIRVAIALDEDRYGDALRGLLGEAQWAKLSACAEVLDPTRFAKLVEAYTAHLGTTVGESVASSRS